MNELQKEQTQAVQPAEAPALAERLAIIEEGLRKNYLTRLDEMEIVPAADRLPALEDDLIDNVRLYHITEMVYKKGESVVDKLTTVFNTLSTYRASVFVVMDSDGKKTDFYLGVRNDEPDENLKRSTVTLGDTLKNALIGHFPGVKIENEDRMHIAALSNKIARQHNAAAVSVVGSPRSKASPDEAYVQGLEKLALAMSGRPYIGILAAETAQTSTSAFHKAYVSKVLPDCGKYGDAAKFAAEMVPGVAEYNAVREGDWAALALSAGMDAGAIASGTATGGAGYVAVKGGGEALAKQAVKEGAEIGAKKTAQEVAEAGAKTVTKEVAEAGAEKAVQEGLETTGRKGLKTTFEEATKKVASKFTKESVEEGGETTAKEGVKEGTERATERAALKIGDKIEYNKKLFREYFDEIVKTTGREIPKEQKKCIEKYCKENELRKLSPEETKNLDREYNRLKPKLIQEWEARTGQEWPRYEKDIVDSNGKVLRRKGQLYDGHHIIEKSAGGPNEWWNLHPAAFPNEHQAGIHGVGSKAQEIFEYRSEPCLKAHPITGAINSIKSNHLK